MPEKPDVLKVPQWLKDYVDLWVDRLEISPQWRIEVEMALAPGDDTANLACCLCISRRQFARLTFRVDIEDTHDNRITIIHELLHVLHDRIDRVLEATIVPNLLESQRIMAQNAYNEAMEPFIDNLARILYQMWAVKENETDRAGDIA